MRSSRLVVDAVFDQAAMLVGLALFGAPALQVFVDVDAHDLVGREEAVVYALPQRVGVHRFAEVVGAGNVPGLLGRCGEADVRGAGEVCVAPEK